jgi:REase_MTES_1575
MWHLERRECRTPSADLDGMSEIDRAVERLAADQHGVFSRAQATASGATPALVWRRLATGVWLIDDLPAVLRLASHNPSWPQRCWAAWLATAPDGVLSHRTAAVLCGLDSIRPGPRVAVTIRRGRHHRRLPLDIHQRPLDVVDRRVVGGLVVTSPERTLLDLAGLRLPPAVIEDALEGAIRLGLTTAKRVARRVEELAAPGRPGIVLMRQVLAERVPGRPRGSRLEMVFARLARQAGLAPPVPQLEVVAGRRYFIDFAIPDARLAIEIDSWEHHSSRAAFVNDRTRQNDLVAAGWTPLRFTSHHLRHEPERVVTTLLRAAAANTRFGGATSRPA